MLRAHLVRGIDLWNEIAILIKYLFFCLVTPFLRIAIPMGITNPLKNERNSYSLKNIYSSTNLIFFKKEKT
jgi:hypothetical protein